MDKECQSPTKECWYSTIECPEEPVEGPLNYAIRTFWAGPEEYEWYECTTGRKLDVDGRRLKAYPDGKDDVGSWQYFWDEEKGEWYLDWTNDENNINELCCMGLVDESLMQFPCIDWKGYDEVGGDFNHDTWCEPDNPGPGDIVIFGRTNNPAKGHVEFVFTSPTINVSVSGSGLTYWYFAA